MKPPSTSQAVPKEGGADPEVQSVKNIIRNLERAEKGCVLYPPNSEILQGFIRDLVKSFQEHLEKYSSIDLTISSTELTFRGIPVYVNEDRGKSLAFRFFQSGLRNLSFQPGLTEEEILEFLDILRKVQAVDNQDDDIVTLLWESNCPHIGYITIDYFSDEESREVVRKLAQAQVDPQSVTSKIIRHITTTSIEVDSSLVPTEEDEERIEEDLYSLRPEELEELREKVNWEADYNPLYDFSSVLFRILEEPLSNESFEDIAKVLRGVIGVMVAKGFFQDAAEIVKRTREFLQQPQRTPEQQKILSQMLKDLATSEVVEEAGLYLKRVKKPEEREGIIQFLRSLGPDALLPIIHLLRKVEIQDELIDLIDELSGDDPSLILTKLYDKHLRVVRAMMRVLAKKANPRTVREILPFLRHSKLEVRLEALEALRHFDSPMARKEVLRYIDDPDLTFKKAALKYLTELGVSEIFPQLLEIVQDKHFNDRDFYEKKALLVALAKSNPMRALPILQQLLEQRRWFFGREKYNETRQCAALALGETNLKDAVPILEKFVTDRSSDVARACTLALKNLVG